LREERAFDTKLRVREGAVEVNASNGEDVHAGRNGGENRGYGDVGEKRSFELSSMRRGSIDGEGHYGG